MDTCTARIVRGSLVVALALLSGLAVAPAIAARQGTLPLQQGGIPAGPAPQLDGRCRDDEYPRVEQVASAPLFVWLVRDEARLYVCISGLREMGADAYVYLDAHASRDRAPEPGDVRLVVYVHEGGRLDAATGQAGKWAGGGPGGWDASTSEDGNEVEYAIPLEFAGGSCGISFGLAAGGYGGIDPVESLYPKGASGERPDTWAMFGLEPCVLEPGPTREEPPVVPPPDRPPRDGGGIVAVICLGLGVAGAALGGGWLVLRLFRRPPPLPPPGPPREPPGQPRPFSPPIPSRAVQLDFVDAANPAVPLGANDSLRAGGRYLLRLAIASRDVAVPGGAALPLNAAVFNDGFAALEQADGVLSLFAQGPAVVTRAAARPRGVDAQVLGRYLYFGVQAPDRPGVAALRVSVYHQGGLVQSWHVAAQVTPNGARMPGAQQFENDFSVSAGFDAAHLQALGTRTLSVLANANADGTHGIRVVGGDDLRASFNLSAAQVTTMVDEFRTRLRAAMYANPTAPADQLRYRYGADNRGDEQTLCASLISLAFAGWRLFEHLFSESATAASYAAAQQIAARAARPGTMQFAVRDGAAWGVPWASVYDRFIQGPPEQVTVCDAFLRAYRAQADLAAEPCFQGRCPHLGDARVACPSGFWGFRNILEQLPSLKGRDLALAVARSGGVTLDAAMSADPGLRLRRQHLDVLRQMVATLHAGENLAAIRTVLAAGDAQVVYFYCHGNRQGTIPFLSVGRPEDGEYFAPDYVRGWGLDWGALRPLVFINGCHTVDLMPEDLLNFAQRFMQVAGASAVIGTEITIVESLAVQYAEEFVQAFVAGRPLGEVTRTLRLKLLSRGNPLGLVYTPYGFAGLKLA